MTAIVDKVSEEAQNIMSKEDDVVGGVIENQNTQLISELQLAKEAYQQNGELEKLIAELTSAEAEWEQGGEALAKVKDLRDTLKAENIVIIRIL